MNKKTIAITAGVIGLIGLGLLIHYLHQNSEADDYVPAKPKQPSPAKKPPVHKTTHAASQGQPPASKAKPVAPPVKQNPVQVKPVSQPKVEKHAEPPIVQELKADLAEGDDFPLRLGSQGPRVERLQVYLMRNYGRTGKVTGVFDEQTQAQVKKRFHSSQLDEKTYQKFRMGNHVKEQVIIR